MKLYLYLFDMGYQGATVWAAESKEDALVRYAVKYPSSSWIQPKRDDLQEFEISDLMFIETIGDS